MPEDKPMAFATKEKKAATRSVVGVAPVPVKFHMLDEKEKAAFLKKMKEGKVVLRGPDHHVIEIDN